MDPITQGAIGAAVAQSFSRHKRDLKLAAAAGWIGGMAPDLDVFIRSSTDPLLALEYHRHFTHALAFIPVGGALVGLFCWLVTRRRHSLPHMVLFATIGMATHGLVDALTSYGTLLLWTFSHVRISWDTLAIIDLFFTIPLLLGIFAAIRWRSHRVVRVAVAVSGLWMMFGAYQHVTLKRAQAALAAERGHTISHSRVMPLLKVVNPLFSWRSVYVADEVIYVDGMTYRPFRAPHITAGGSLPRFDARALAATLPAESPLARDLRRYDWFADTLTASLPDDPTVIVDMRYGASGATLRPMWGIRITPEAPQHPAERVRFPRFEQE
jgi:inner membrane protein